MFEPAYQNFGELNYAFIVSLKEIYHLLTNVQTTFLQENLPKIFYSEICLIKSIVTTYFNLVNALSTPNLSESIPGFLELLLGPEELILNL